MSQLSREKLTDEGLRAGLEGLPGWDLDSGMLAKTFQFSSYWEGVEFAVFVAKVAEELDHHPDLTIGYQKVRVATSTHDADGITAWDLELAKKASQLAG